MRSLKDEVPVGKKRALYGGDYRSWPPKIPQELVGKAEASATQEQLMEQKTDMQRLSIQLEQLRMAQRNAEMTADSLATEKKGAIQEMRVQRGQGRVDSLSIAGKCNMQEQDASQMSETQECSIRRNRILIRRNIGNRYRSRIWMRTTNRWKGSRVDTCSTRTNAIPTGGGP